MYSSSMATFQTIIDDMTALTAHLKTLLTEEVDAVVAFKPSKKNIMVSVLQLPDDMIRLVGSFINIDAIYMKKARLRFKRLSECQQREVSRPYHVDLWKPYAHKITAKCIFIANFNEHELRHVRKQTYTRYDIDDGRNKDRLDEVIRSKYHDYKLKMIDRYNNKYWKSNTHFVRINGTYVDVNLGSSQDVQRYFMRMKGSFSHTSLPAIYGLPQQGCMFLFQGKYECYADGKSHDDWHFD